MPKRKINKKELKQPDHFVDFWTHASTAVGEFAATRTRALIIGLTALLTVVIGSIVLAQVSERRAVSASEALTRVEQIATADLIAPGVTPKDDGLPHFGTEKERLEAALKELEGAFGAGRGPLRPEASLVRGALLLDLDRGAEAEAVYDKLLGGKLDGRLRFLAIEGLAYADERQGKLDQALAVLGKLADAGGAEGFYKDRALYGQARLAELRGNPGDAKRIYQEVLDTNPTTSLRDQINSRLAALEIK